MSMALTAMTLSDAILSMSLSLLPMALFALWILSSLWRQDGVYRITGMEIGLGLLVVGGLIGFQIAGDKRMALNDLMITIGPILTALLLVQLLDTSVRRRLLLAVVVGLGVAATVQGLDQLSFSNQASIEQYQADPNSMLGPMGIDPGTLQEFMFEHRLYSQGMRSFFTTRNSLAVFLLLSLWGGLLVTRQQSPHKRQWLLWILSGVVLMGLILTKSKGSLISLVLALGTWGIWTGFGKRLKPHNRRIILCLVLLAIMGVLAIIHYGQNHGRLPGGNSMWVRWQYWAATGTLLRENPFTGVGPGNFGFAYQQVKPAAALEAVSDPHNLLLSVWARFGLMGLVGWVCLLMMPWFKAIPKEVPTAESDQDHNRPFWTTVVAVSLALLVFRPALFPPEMSTVQAVNIYLIITQYGIPWALVLFVLAVLRPWFRQSGSLPTTALLCGLGATLFANLTDFALFEPAVATPFWILIAIVLMEAQRVRPTSWSHWGKGIKSLIALVAIGLVIIVTLTAWWPLSLSTDYIQSAYVAMEHGRPQQALAYLEQAAAADPLSPDPWRTQAKLLDAINEHQPDRDTVQQAIAARQEAWLRNPRDYRIQENLGDDYAKLRQWDQAAVCFQQATELYPGCGRLWYKLAQAADYQHENELALTAYARAVAAEEAFREQFLAMYGQEKTPVSRLGQDEFTIAKQRLGTLQNSRDKD